MDLALHPPRSSTLRATQAILAAICLPISQLALFFAAVSRQTVLNKGYERES
jgi:hypothetical protein